MKCRQKTIFENIQNSIEVWEFTEDDRKKIHRYYQSIRILNILKNLQVCHQR